MSEHVHEVEQSVEALLCGELGPISSLFAPDVEWHAWGDAIDGIRGEDAVTEALRDRLDGGLDRAELVECIDAGQSVVVVLRLPGRPLFAAPGANDQVISLTFAGDRVIGLQDYRSRSEALLIPIFD